MKHAENPGKGGGDGTGRSKIPSLAGNRRSPCLSEEQTSLRVVHDCVSSCVCHGVGVCGCVYGWVTCGALLRPASYFLGTTRLVPSRPWPPHRAAS